MLDDRALLEKHRSKGVLVDTNLLLLLLVGTVNTQRIRRFKRSENYSTADFDLLVSLIAHFGKLIATPHMLSQVSDLTDLHGPELHQVRQLFKLVVQEQIQELYERSSELVDHHTFERLGLTDAAIATACSQGILVLTADVELYLALQRHGLDAINFNHISAAGLKLELLQHN